MKFKDMMIANHRAVYATLVCVCTLLINLIYPVYYNANPAAMISLFPLILWVAYDGNEKEKGTIQGYWVWIGALLLTTAILIIYPIF